MTARNHQQCVPVCTVGDETSCRWNDCPQGMFIRQGRATMLDDRATGFTEAELMAILPALQQFARRFHRGASDVDDLVQETLTKAIGSSHRFQRGSNLRSWLFTIM